MTHRDLEPVALNGVELDAPVQLWIRIRQVDRIGRLERRVVTQTPSSVVRLRVGEERDGPAAYVMRLQEGERNLLYELIVAKRLVALTGEAHEPCPPGGGALLPHTTTAPKRRESAWGRSKALGPTRPRSLRGLVTGRPNHVPPRTIRT